MAETYTEMNLERARAIVASGNRGKDYDDALQFLRLYDPENPNLPELSDKEKEDIARINKEIDVIIDNINHDRNEREILGDEKHDLNDDEKVAQNFGNISAIFEDEEFKKRLNLKLISNTANIDIDAGGNILGKGDDKDVELRGAEKDLRKSVLNELLEAAKHEVLMFYGQDKDFAANSKNTQRKILEDGVIEVFNFKVARSVADSAIRKPTAKEADPDSKAGQDYQQRVLADMRAALETYYKKDIQQPAKVSTQSILTSTVRTSVDMDDYEENLRNAKMAKSAESFNEKKDIYNQKRRNFWDKAFDNLKGLWQSMKKKKWQILTNVAVVGGMGLLAPVAPITAAGLMSTYFFAGAFGWQINDERLSLQEKIKRKVSMTEAARNIWTDKEKQSKFMRTGIINGVAGVAGGALFGWAATGNMAAFLGLNSGAAAAAANPAATNTLLAAASRTTAMTTGSSSALGTEWFLADKNYKANPTEENKKKVKTAKQSFLFGAGVGLGANILTTALAFDGISDAATGTDVPGVDPSVDPTIDPSVEPSVPGAETGVDQSVPGSETGAEPGIDSGATIEATPVEWQGDISAKQWESLTRDVTGIYKDHAEIFGKENVLPEDAMNNAYMNIDNARAEGFFQGQSNEEVLYKYVQSIKFTERAEILKGTNYLVTKLDSNGLPMYWHNSEEMNALTRIIICGEKVEISADRLGDTLALIDENGQYTGEGANIGVTNNQYVGGTYDCDEYQNAWEKHNFVAKHNGGNIPPTPVNTEETTVDNSAPATGAKVDETIQDVVKQPQGRNIKFNTQTYTTGDNYAGSPTGSHAPKTGVTGFAPEAAARAAVKNAGYGN